MAKRKRIALIYSYNENWIGGTYYIENLISALSKLPDIKRPELFVFSDSTQDSERLQASVHYPHWSFRQFERSLSNVKRMLNKITYKVFKRKLFSNLYSDIDLVFPVSLSKRFFFSKISDSRHLYWIPDFQEHYLPNFFKNDELIFRKDEQIDIQKIAKYIIFSSNSAKQDFNTIYPSNKLVQYVLQFRVSSGNSKNSDIDWLDKYNLPDRYFICSNQFWKHKNHVLILYALSKLRSQGISATVVFTGKEHDHRNPEYFDELMTVRDNLGLIGETKFLGFIPREAQLFLMQNSLAIIQPSLFEGWSTVIEDGKSLNVNIVASDIAVHIEQLDNYLGKLLFNPHDSSSLAYQMEKVLNGNITNFTYDYSNDVTQYAEKFIDIINNITNSTD